MAYEYMTLKKQGRTAVITFCRPEVRNQITNELMAELHGIVKELETDRELRAVIITAEGKAFAAGADLNMLLSFSVVEERACSAMGIEVCRDIENSQKVYICALNGYAFGGGLELAMACDIRIASDKAIFGLPETKVGIIPGYGGTQRLSRLVGFGRAKEILLTGRNVDAAEAERIGLVNFIVPADKVMEKALEEAELLSKNAPIAMGLAKQVMLSDVTTGQAAASQMQANALAIAYSSDDAKEGMRAFLERREPQFKNK